MTTGEETALHYAASKGHVQVIKYLHEQCNGDLNATYSKVITSYSLNFVVNTVVIQCLLRNLMNKSLKHRPKHLMRKKGILSLSNQHSSLDTYSLCICHSRTTDIFIYQLVSSPIIFERDQKTFTCPPKNF